MWLDKPEDLGAHLIHTMRSTQTCMCHVPGSDELCLSHSRSSVSAGCGTVRIHSLRWSAITIEHKIFRENANATAESGRRPEVTFNPGHSIEVAWFLLHLCNLREERPYV